MSDCDSGEERASIGLIAHEDWGSKSTGTDGRRKLLRLTVGESGKKCMRGNKER